MRLKGKTAVITGAGSGYGAGIARRFAAEGARVAVVDINAEAASAVAKSFGGDAIAVGCDVSNSESVGAMVAEVVRQFGSFDTLINNAAITQKPKRIAKTTEAEIDRLFAVNIKSIYHMATHALPVIRKGGGGCVINIASIGPLRPRGGMHWYNASKAAVITLTMSMASELAPDKIRVNAIGPAIGRTPMGHSMFDGDTDAALDKLVSTSLLGRLCEPEDIASAAVYLASDDASYVTGIMLPVDGGRLVA